MHADCPASLPPAASLSSSSRPDPDPDPERASAPEWPPGTKSFDAWRRPDGQVPLPEPEPEGRSSSAAGQQERRERRVV